MERTHWTRWTIIINIVALWLIGSLITSLSLSLTPTNRTICQTPVAGLQLNEWLMHSSFVALINTTCLTLLYNIQQWMFPTLQKSPEEEEEDDEEEEEEEEGWSERKKRMIRYMLHLPLLIMTLIFLIYLVVTLFSGIAILSECQFQSLHSLATSIYCLNVCTVVVLFVMYFISPLCLVCKKRLFNSQ